MDGLEPVTQHRTQLYLPTSLYQKVKQKAEEENISMAKLFRSLLEEKFKVEVGRRKGAKEKVWQKFFASAGIGSGPKDLSYHHDRYFEHQ